MFATKVDINVGRYSYKVKVKVKVKVKQSRYRSGGAQRVLGSYGPQIS